MWVKWPLIVSGISGEVEPPASGGGHTATARHRTLCFAHHRHFFAIFPQLFLFFSFFPQFFLLGLLSPHIIFIFACIIFSLFLATHLFPQYCHTLIRRNKKYFVFLPFAPIFTWKIGGGVQIFGIFHEYCALTTLQLFRKQIKRHNKQYVLTPNYT